MDDYSGVCGEGVFPLTQAVRLAMNKTETSSFKGHGDLPDKDLRYPLRGMYQAPGKGVALMDRDSQYVPLGNLHKEVSSSDETRVSHEGRQMSDSSKPQLKETIHERPSGGISEPTLLMDLTGRLAKMARSMFVTMVLPTAEDREVGVAPVQTGGSDTHKEGGVEDNHRRGKRSGKYKLDFSRDNVGGSVGVY